MMELVEPSQIRSQGSPAFRSVQQGSSNTCRVQMSLGGKRQSGILEDIEKGTKCLRSIGYTPGDIISWTGVGGDDTTKVNKWRDALHDSLANLDAHAIFYRHAMAGDEELGLSHTHAKTKDEATSENTAVHRSAASRVDANRTASSAYSMSEIAPGTARRTERGNRAPIIWRKATPASIPRSNRTADHRSTTRRKNKLKRTGAITQPWQRPFRTWIPSVYPPGTRTVAPN